MKSSLLALLGYVCLASIVPPSAPVQAAEKAPPGLDERYRKWLDEEALWILTREERGEFLGLTSNEERDRFIDRFWKIRDPQPLTPANEFRDEHYRRLAHVARQFSADAARKGYKTDRGRVYILLGKPTDVERSLSPNEIYPYELWFYGNVSGLGLPGQLRLLFYRPFGAGEYRLLNPVLDLDRLFPPSSQVFRAGTSIEELRSPSNFSQLASLIGPEVVQAIEGVAPGYSANTSAEVIGELLAPRLIPERIRDRGLALNPDVKTRWSLERLSLPLKVLVEPQADGAARVHLGAELPAKEVSFQEVAEDRFTARIDAFGEVLDEKGVAVARFDEAATVTLPRRELEARRANAFSFEALRLLIPGRYRVNLLLQDFSRGKLGHAEAEIEVPAGRPALSPLALAFRVDRPDAGAAAAGEAPFTVSGFRLHQRPGARYAVGEPVYVFAILHDAAGDLEVSVEVKGPGGSLFQASAPSRAAAGDRPLLLTIPTGTLAAATYEVALGVRKGAQIIATASTPLELTTAPVPPGLFVYAERRPTPAEVEHFNRGVQFLSRGDLDSAQRHFKIALQHRQNFHPASVYLARIHLIGGAPAEAEPLLAAVLAADPDNYDALLTRGSLLLSRRDYAGAAASLQRALEVGARTKELLNGLGEASLGLRQADDARRYFSDSLALDPSQDAIRKRLAAIEGT